MTLRQREPREECPDFLAFLRRRPCTACGASAPSQAAHIRMASIQHNKRSTGIGEKPHDRWAIPLCAGCHLDEPYAQHNVGERKFWGGMGVNPFAEAEGLYQIFLDEGGKPGAAPKVSGRIVRKTKVSHSRASDSRPKVRPPKRKPKITITVTPLRSRRERDAVRDFLADIVARGGTFGTSRSLRSASRWPKNRKIQNRGK